MRDLTSLALFHGTVLSNIPLILENGFCKDRLAVWNESEPGLVYAWSQYHSMKDMLDEYFEESLDKDEVLFYALDSAICAAAIRGYKGRNLAVIEFSSDFESLSEDWSCNDHTSHAYTLYASQAHYDIKRIHIFERAYNPDMRYFYFSKNMIELANILTDEEYKFATMVTSNVDLSDITCELGDYLRSIVPTVIDCEVSKLHLDEVKDIAKNIRGNFNVCL